MTDKLFLILWFVGAFIFLIFYIAVYRHTHKNKYQIGFHVQAVGFFVAIIGALCGFIFTDVIYSPKIVFIGIITGLIGLYLQVSNRK
jgi:hypothetical protein